MKRQLLVLLMLCSILCHAQTEVPGSYPAVSTDWLEARELEQFDEYELSLMRNEVFARYGYIFKKEELREYFSDKTWYKPQPWI